MEKFKNLSRQTKILSVTSVLCVIVTIIMSVNTVRFFTERKVKVTATVSRLEYYDNSTVDEIKTGYNVYVNYQCLGNSYKDIYYTEAPVNTDLTEGAKLDIQVYEKSPDKIAQNMSVNGLFFLVASVVLIVITVKKAKDEQK